MEFRNVNGHIEVYNNNKFLFSEDNREEAEKELRKQMNIKIITQPFKSGLRKVCY